MLPSPLVTLDQDRFFKDSLYGKAALARAEAWEAYERAVIAGEREGLVPGG